MDTDGEGVMNREGSTDLYTLPCVKQITNGKHRELNLVLCDDLEGWDEGWEGDSREGGYMYTYS